MHEDDEKQLRDERAEGLGARDDSSEDYEPEPAPIIESDDDLDESGEAFTPVPVLNVGSVSESTHQTKPAIDDDLEIYQFYIEEDFREGRMQVAAFISAAMVVGLALAMHAWLPDDPNVTRLILLTAGMAVWFIGAFGLRLAFEGPFLYMLVTPVVVFIGAMLSLMLLAQHDVPPGIELLDAALASGPRMER